MLNTNHPEFFICNFLPFSFMGKLILEWFPLPNPNSFLAINSNKEVPDSITSINSIQQSQVMYSQDVICESIHGNPMITTAQTMWVTGDQIIEEVRISSSKKTQTNLFSSLIPPKIINLSLGGQ
jgi:hypothetical protein